MQKNTGLKVVGILLLIGGIIAIIVGIAGISNVESQSNNLSGDYLTRYIKGEGLAAQKTPYYITLGFGIASSILGLILTVIKPRQRVLIANSYSNNIPQGNVMKPIYKCPACGSVVNEKDIYCMSCGCNLKQLQQTESISQSNQNIVCPNCKTHNKKGSSFCSSCGCKL